MCRMAADLAVYNQNVAHVSALPASFGMNNPGTAAHAFQHHTQVTVVVPAFPTTNGLETWEAGVCRGIAAADASHVRREIVWFL